MRLFRTLLAGGAAGVALLAVTCVPALADEGDSLTSTGGDSSYTDYQPPASAMPELHAKQQQAAQLRAQLEANPNSPVSLTGPPGAGGQQGGGSGVTPDSLPPGSGVTAYNIGTIRDHKEGAG